MAPCATNMFQEVASIIFNNIRVVPCIDPKHKGEQQIKLEKYHIKVKIDGLTVKRSIKSRNTSDLNRFESFKPKFTESDNRSH